MAKLDEDKYSALWVSHSSISDFLACPRAYYLANVYKNPRTGRKINIINPPLALGQSVHAVLENLSSQPVNDRFSSSLMEKFEQVWQKVSGKKGGFRSDKQEIEYKERGAAMIKKVEKNPGPLQRKAVKIKQDLPHYWLSGDEGIILCGKLDWIEYLEDDNAVHVIDFKTGRRTEKSDSLQLPIYYLLTTHCQSRSVEKMSYWYLDKDDKPQEEDLPDEEIAHDQIMQVAKRMKLAKKLNLFKCSHDEKNGCFSCAPYEAIVKGHGEFVGVGDYGREIYVLDDNAVSL